MGQKVDPRGLRIGIIKTWNSNWFAQGKDYLNNLHEDLKIKELKGRQEKLGFAFSP